MQAGHSLALTVGSLGLLLPCVRVLALRRANGVSRATGVGMGTDSDRPAARERGANRTRWEQFVAVLGGRRIVLAHGLLLLAIGVGWGPMEVSRGTPVSTALLLSAFISGPGVILLYNGYRLPQSDFREEFYPVLVSRSLGGFGAMAVIVVIYQFQPAGGSSRPFVLLFVLGAFGSVAGYLVGRHDARATELERTQARLNATVERLETSNELLDEFAYAASHDLQEPLRMVSSHLLLLERRYGDDLDEEATEYIDFAIDRADRMREMIDALLEYSLIETADDPLEPVDLDAVVADVLADIHLQVEEHDAEIEVEPLPRVMGDANQLHHVFQNLLINAIEYSGDEAPRVRVSAERNSPDWTVTVQDEGIGIHPDETDRVFRVFERLDPQRDDGTGIGLTICKRIIERHGGEIWVDSEPGEGAAFKFKLSTTDEWANE